MFIKTKYLLLYLLFSVSVIILFFYLHDYYVLRDTYIPNNLIINMYDMDNNTICDNINYFDCMHHITTNNISLQITNIQNENIWNIYFVIIIILKLILILFSIFAIQLFIYHTYKKQYIYLILMLSIYLFFYLIFSISLCITLYKFHYINNLGLVSGAQIYYNNASINCTNNYDCHTKLFNIHAQHKISNFIIHTQNNFISYDIFSIIININIITYISILIFFVLNSKKFKINYC